MKNRLVSIAAVGMSLVLSTGLHNMDLLRTAVHSMGVHCVDMHGVDVPGVGMPAWACPG